MTRDFGASLCHFVDRFVDVGFIYAILAFTSIPSYASKLPRHLGYGVRRRDFRTLLCHFVQRRTVCFSLNGYDVTHGRCRVPRGVCRSDF